MSQNGFAANVPRMHSAGAFPGMLGQQHDEGSDVIRSSSSPMAQSASWGGNWPDYDHEEGSNRGNVAQQQRGGGPGEGGGDGDEDGEGEGGREGPPASPQSSSSSPSAAVATPTPKEHDLLGFSVGRQDENSAQDSSFQSEGGLNLNLNLGATELTLGPQAREGGGGQEAGGGVCQRMPADGDLERTGNFLLGTEGGRQDNLVSDRRSSNAADYAPTAEQQWQQLRQVMDVGFGYNPLERGGGSGPVDVLESTASRASHDRESFHRWQDRKATANEGTLRLGMGPPRPKRHDEEAAEKLGLNVEDARRHSLLPEGLHHQRQQHGYPDGSSWPDRNPHLDDASSAERVGARDRGMSDRGGAPPDHQQQQQQQQQRQQQEQQQGKEAADSSSQKQQQQDPFVGEKRSNVQEVGKTLLSTFQNQPDGRFVRELGGALPDRSPRQADEYMAPTSNGWQSQVLRPGAEFHHVQHQQQQQQQQADESSRNGFPGGAGFLGSRALFPPAKAAKRPFDTIGGGGLVGGNSAPDTDPKSKAQQSALYQPWAAKSSPTWQALHSGGSFGPFPSPSPCPSSTSPVTGTQPAAEPANMGGDGAQKAWEAETKSLQEPASAPGTPESKASAAPQAGPPAEATFSTPRVAAPPAQAVGWPPLRSFRKNTMTSQHKPSPAESKPRPPQPSSPAAPFPAPAAAGKPNCCMVKVHMDGVFVGRKVDLRANCSYEKLSLALEDMFRGSGNGWIFDQSSREATSTEKSNFIRGTEYVLTYEDKDGDLMLVGDVPWTLFVQTVKRLRIMKGSEAIGLGSRAGSRATEKANNMQLPV